MSRPNDATPAGLDQVELDQAGRAELRAMAALLTLWNPEFDRPAEREAGRLAWQLLARQVLERVPELCDRLDAAEVAEVQP